MAAKPTIVLSADVQPNFSERIRFPALSVALALTELESPTTMVSCGTTICTCAAKVVGTNRQVFVTARGDRDARNSCEGDRRAASAAEE